MIYAKLHLSFFRSTVVRLSSPLTLLSTNYKAANQSTMMSLVKESVDYRSTVVLSYSRTLVQRKKIKWSRLNHVILSRDFKINY